MLVRLAVVITLEGNKMFRQPTDLREMHQHRRNKRKESLNRPESNVDEQLADGFEMLGEDDSGDDNNYTAFTNQTPLPPT